MKRCVIIGAAKIDNYQKVKSFLSKNDFCIVCDGGLNHLHSLEVQPDLIIGDFDSHENPCLPTETIVLPCEKDDTDTIFAAKEAVKRGFTDFLLLGVCAGRLDHTFGNLSILLKLSSLKLNCSLIDDFSQMQIVNPENPGFIEDSYSFFSVINMDGTSEGITIENAKYCVENANISCDFQLGISNQVLKGQTAKVTVKKGNLLLIKVW